jgi:hypothetical protein
MESAQRSQSLRRRPTEAQESATTDFEEFDEALNGNFSSASCLFLNINAHQEFRFDAFGLNRHETPSVSHHHVEIRLWQTLGPL